MHCKYQLRWYDNIPILSWLMLGGRCRKCRKKIGCAEILAEVGLATVYVLSFLLWPEFDKLMALNVFEGLKFVLFLINLVIFTILFIYDAKWKELPVGLMIAAGVIAAIFLGVAIGQSYAETGSFDWLSLALALVILPGVYYLLYRISGESWVGGGDWILCIPLALMLGNAWLAAFCLFGANIIGCLVSVPIAFLEEKKHMSVPFGPFLIVGFWLVFMLQDVTFNFVAI